MQVNIQKGETFDRRQQSSIQNQRKYKRNKGNAEYSSSTSFIKRKGERKI